jgi:nucleoside-diphosphate-sugar epimerase
MRQKRIAVTGAGGFIGHSLVRRLKKDGYWVRGIDQKLPEYEKSDADEFSLLDLRNRESCCEALNRIEEVYHLAANMGGIGFIETHKAEIVADNTKIDLFMLDAAKYLNVNKLLYTSSACVYPMHLQQSADVRPLREEDAYPADPEDGYGWEKLYAERMCRHFMDDFGLDVRIARFHNIYGPLGTYDGGREKSPAAICRKIALCPDGGLIEVWGDGKQTRSYCYIDDCTEGLVRLMDREYAKPVNIGRDDMISIDGLVDLVARIAGKKIGKRYDPSKPRGVVGRNADTTLCRKVLGWEPQISMEKGMEVTYRWIEGRVKSA